MVRVLSSIPTGYTTIADKVQKEVVVVAGREEKEG